MVQTHCLLRDDEVPVKAEPFAMTALAGPAR
jgi:hypothetical protein